MAFVNIDGSSGKYILLLLLLMSKIQKTLITYCSNHSNNKFFRIIDHKFTNRENSLKGYSVNKSSASHLVTKLCQFVSDLGLLALSDDFKRLGNSV